MSPRLQQYIAPSRPVHAFSCREDFRRLFGRGFRDGLYAYRGRCVGLGEERHAEDRAEYQEECGKQAQAGEIEPWLHVGLEKSGAFPVAPVVRFVQEGAVRPFCSE